MVDDYFDEGVINLASALLAQAKEEYQMHLDCCNDLQARICAVVDSHGIVGKILEYATGDREFMVKEIDKKISS